MGKLILEDESYAIRDAVFEVYKEMGCGCLEAVYQECLKNELRTQGIPSDAKKQLSVLSVSSVVKSV